MISPITSYNQTFCSKYRLKGTTFPLKPEKKEEKLPEVISRTMEKIENAATGKQAAEVLVNAGDNGDFKVYNGVRYKNGEYQIQNLFAKNGIKYEQDLKKLNSLNLGIVPKHIKTVKKNKDMFILTKIPGSKNGDLIPYEQGKDSVSPASKNEAYRDLKTLTKAGYTDDKILKSNAAWFVTPDDKKVIIPSFESFRTLRPGENKEVLCRYQKILFG